MDSATHQFLQMDWIGWHPSMIMGVLVFSIPIVAIVGHFWHETIKTRSETELKRQMIEQGMSADDIERVLAARGPESEHDRKKRLRREAVGGV